MLTKTLSDENTTVEFENLKELYRFNLGEYSLYHDIDSASERVTINTILRTMYMDAQHVDYRDYPYGKLDKLYKFLVLVDKNYGWCPAHLFFTVADDIWYK